MELETMGLEELQAEAVKAGMSEDVVSSFTSKKQVIAVINSLKAKDVKVEEERVASLEEKVNPAEDKKINKQWLSKAEKMRDRLLAQPQVSFLANLEPNEKRGVVEWRTDKNGNPYQIHVSGDVHVVQLNGFKWLVPKGVMTKIPEQVAEELSTSYNITLEAGKDIDINRIDEKTGQPVMNQL